MSKEKLSYRKAYSTLKKYGLDLSQKIIILSKTEFIRLSNSYSFNIYDDVCVIEGIDNALYCTFNAF